jgi:hypothetical protein
MPMDPKCVNMRPVCPEAIVLFFTRKYLSLNTIRFQIHIVFEIMIKLINGNGLLLCPSQSTRLKKDIG